MKIFVSHAHEDNAVAQAVAHRLRGAGMDVLLDIDDVELGRSFVAFIENALAGADHCLLLWSRASAAKPWVQTEWESALARSIAQRCAFLLCARLDDQPLPHLLAPRLAVNLFPDVDRGMHQLVAMLRRDAQVARAAGVPVGRPSVELAAVEQGSEVYVVSELFGLALPVSAALHQPAAVLTARLQKELELPTHWSFQDRFGEHFLYSLMRGEQVLGPAVPLDRQSVVAGDVLTLCVTRRPFAAVAPASGQSQPVVFRGDTNPAANKAYRSWRSALLAKGLRPTAAWLTPSA